MKKIFNILITIGLLSGCSSGDSNSTELDSDDYESKEDRIEILKKEINPYSDFYDAEFELFNVNGFHNQRIVVPGASSWNYKFVVRIDTINISKWTSGMSAVNFTDYDDSWTKEITKHRKQNWKTESEPQYFVRDKQVTMILYKNEGIIFKSVINE